MVSALIADFYNQSQKTQETEDTFTDKLQILVRKIVAQKPEFVVLFLKQQKIMAPQTLDQSDREKVSGPDWIDYTNKEKGIVGLMEKISSQQVSAQVKIEVMHRAMATCPRINMGCGRKMIPSLLDSGSQATLICQSFF